MLEREGERVGGREKTAGGVAGRVRSRLPTKQGARCGI